MQPYQQATQEIQRQGELPLTIAKNVGTAAASAYFGGGAINRVLPFLSKYIPEDLVKKGLSKIDPRYGKFLDKALSAGQTIDQAKEFIGEKIQESQPKKAPDQRSILEQYSPELSQFIQSEIQKGRSPIEAGALAQNDKRFKPAIDKMTKDHKTQFSNILESIFGGGQMAQQQTQQKAQPQQPQQAQPQSQGGPGQQALMQTMNKIMQQLGG